MASTDVERILFEAGAKAPTELTRERMQRKEKFMIV